VHQLAAPGAVCPCLVAGLPRRRAGGHRGPHAGVLVRARDRRRAPGDEGASDRLPVCVDNNYEVWSAFDNHYWPALYFVDAEGKIRDQHFGEGRYEQSERVIQRLLGVERELVSVEGDGVEAEADWDDLRTPEMYLGYARGERSASPDRLPLNHWALARRVDDRARERRARRPRRQHRPPLPRARRASRAVRRGARGDPVPRAARRRGPSLSHGVNVDERGNGVLEYGRLYQLVRQRESGKVWCSRRPLR
jgi:hypothetical protein